MYRAAALALFFAAALRLDAWPVDPKVYCSVDMTYNYGMLTSRGGAVYHNNWDSAAPATLTGFHWIGRSDNGPSPAGESIYTETGSWAGTVSGPATTPPSGQLCYNGQIEATAPDTQNQGAGSGAICFDAPPPPPPQNPPPVPAGVESWEGNACSPIVFNLGRGGYELSGIDRAVLFDIDADGSPNVMTWTAPGAEMGFLALDRNGNGRIDDGAELFGNHTLLPNGRNAQNGFEALRQFDTNGDGVIDTSDAVWQRLLIWIDQNHDGVSSADELQPIGASGLTAIDLAYHLTWRRDKSGNWFRYEGLARLRGRAQAFYDVYFLAKR